MNQEIIQDFLNIPSVVGIALTQGQLIPYFYVKEEILSWQNKQNLIQEVRTNLKNKDVDFSDFQIMGYYGYIYKLNTNFNLLVLTRTDIATLKLVTLSVNQLKTTLQRDVNKILTTFELLTRKISQPSAVANGRNTAFYSLGVNNSFPASLEVKVTVKELLKALNRLSKFSSNYVGKNLTSNYLQLTRPDLDWLNNFQINRSAEIVFSGVSTEPVSTLQLQSIKEWVAAFIKQCSQIVQDLPILIEEKGLDEEEKNLLLIPPAS